MFVALGGDAELDNQTAVAEMHAIDQERDKVEAIEWRALPSRERGAGAARGALRLVRIPRSTDRRTILLDPRGEDLQARPHGQFQQLGLRVDEQIDRGRWLSEIRPAKRVGLCEPSCSWRLLVGGLAPSLVTTRLPRAVSSRRSHISTATGASPTSCRPFMTMDDSWPKALESRQEAPLAREHFERRECRVPRGSMLGRLTNDPGPGFYRLLAQRSRAVGISNDDTENLKRLCIRVAGLDASHVR